MVRKVGVPPFHRKTGAQISNLAIVLHGVNCEQACHYPSGKQALKIPNLAIVLQCVSRVAWSHQESRHS